MSTWEQRMAAKAAERRREQEQTEQREREREREARRAAYAHLGPCPCPMDPCPFPPWDYEDVPDWWQGHREYFTEVRRTGHCPDCGRRVTPQQAVDHDCPDRIALAAS